MIKGTLDIGLLIKDYILSHSAGFVSIDDIKVDTGIVFKNEDARTEFIHIAVKSLSDRQYWRKGYVEVNLYVPDKGQYPDSERLNQLQTDYYDILKDVIVNNEEETYEFQTEGLPTMEAEPSLKSHFVNFHLLFELWKV